MKFIEEPTRCPSCDFELTKVNDQLFCKNTFCTAQLEGKLVNFAKVLGIKGLGPKTIEKLDLQSVIDIFYLDPNYLATVLGRTLALKLLGEIEKAKTASFSSVLEAFSIPLLGGTTAKKLAMCVNSFEEITVDKCKEAGLGEKVILNLMEWLENDYRELKEFLPFTYSASKSNIPNKTVCITGKLKNYSKKSDVADILQSAGFTLVDSVTKSLDFLVDETDGLSSKRKKAEEYGIKIITDLNDLLKEANKNE